MIVTAVQYYSAVKQTSVIGQGLSFHAFRSLSLTPRGARPLSPFVEFETAWTPESDPHQFVRLVFPHFKAKEVFHLVKQKHASPLGTFCKVLDKRLTGDQKPI